MISDRIYDDIPPQMKKKNEYSYPHSNVLFNFYTSKTPYFVQTVSVVSDVNHYVDQSLATLLLTSENDVGFPTVYRRIYCRKFLTLSNQTSRYIHKCIRIRVSRWGII